VNAKSARVLVVAGALVLALTGCGAKSGSGTTAGTTATANPSPTADPAKDLVGALTKSAGQSFTFKLGDTTDSLEGVYDASNRGVHLTDPSDASTEVVVIGADSWALVEPKTYAHFSALKFVKDSPLIVLADPLAALRWLQAAHDVTLTAPGTFAGKFEVDKVTGTDAATKHLVDVLTQTIGAAGQPLPFTVKLDESGRLASFKTTLPKLDDGKDAEYLFTIAKYGATTPVKKPKGKIIEAPAEAYSASK
jgi:hypothetical protein